MLMAQKDIFSGVPKRKTVQDDDRERQMAELFGLKRVDSRIGVDAIDELGNEYELKTTSKGSVSTARDFGPSHIDKWADKIWIVGLGRNFNTGFKFDEFRVLLPTDMKPWLDIYRLQFESHEELHARVVELIKTGCSAQEVALIKRQLSRGKLLNDPNIPHKHIVEYGVKVDSDHANRLRDIVSRYQRPSDLAELPKKKIKKYCDGLFTVGRDQ